MLNVTVGEILNNYYTFGIERELMERKGQFKTKTTSRKVQVASREFDVRDCVVLIHRGD